MTHLLATLAPLLATADGKASPRKVTGAIVMAFVVAALCLWIRGIYLCHTWATGNYVEVMLSLLTASFWAAGMRLDFIGARKARQAEAASNL